MSLENPSAQPASAARKIRVLAVLLVAVVMAGLVLLAEVGARRLVTLPLERPAPQLRYDAHPSRLFTPRPNQRAYSFGGTVTIGPDGLRRHPAGPSDSSRSTTVIALGDSFTFGMGVDDSATFPAQLEAALRRRAAPARVINAGVISYQVNQELDLLQETLRADSADVVVHGLYWNDYLVNDPAQTPALRVLTDDGLFVWDDAETATDEVGVLTRMARRSSLLFVARRAAATLRAVLGGSRAGEMEYDRVERLLESGVVDTAGFARIPKFYAELQQAAAERGFALFVVIMPVEVIVRGSAPSDHPYPRYARAMLDSLGIPYLDAHRLWEERAVGAELFLPYNKHPNADGYALLGEAAAAWLVERAEWPRR
jgi:lysophospholipase L1-like esterase